jgi:hypothetical protein
MVRNMDSEKDNNLCAGSEGHAIKGKWRKTLTRFYASAPEDFMEKLYRKLKILYFCTK